MYRPQTLNIAAGTLLALTMFSLPFEVRWHIDNQAIPMNMFVWLMVYLLCAYVVFGTRVGGVLNSVSVGIMLLALVSDPPTTPVLVSSWLTGLIVLSVLGVLGYSIIHFIEINLLLHVQDNARLRAARLDALTGVYGRGPSRRNSSAP
ncbi:hypothetical protein ACFSC4_01075 [Deinococcus malanensis]|uniref:hypothetical protein n=1 Tax=Deinococcus malanensis TaxID=1706855 RepID=UPI003640317E